MALCYLLCVLALTNLLRHINTAHSHSPDFHVVCGIDGRTKEYLVHPAPYFPPLLHPYDVLCFPPLHQLACIPRRFCSLLLSLTSMRTLLFPLSVSCCCHFPGVCWVVYIFLRGCSDVGQSQSKTICAESVCVDADAFVFLSTICGVDCEFGPIAILLQVCL